MHIRVRHNRINRLEKCYDSEFGMRECLFPLSSFRKIRLMLLCTHSCFLSILSPLPSFQFSAGRRQWYVLAVDSFHVRVKIHSGRAQGPQLCRGKGGATRGPRAACRVGGTQQVSLCAYEKMRGAEFAPTL